MNTRIPQAFLLAMMAIAVPPATARAVNPPDKNLEAALRALLQEPQKELTDEHYARVFVLDATGKGIKDLSGLEKCKNLASLRLTKNQISDVKPLAGLTNLQSLDLAENQIADLKSLAGLVNLQYLELSKNQVDDVKPLAGLTRLNSLYLSGNKIGDIAPLAGLNRLWSLYLAKNQLKEIGPLSRLNRLSTLELADNQIENVGPLASLSELNLVLLDRNKIADLRPLVAAAEKDVADVAPESVASFVGLVSTPTDLGTFVSLPPLVTGKTVPGPKRFAPFLRLYVEGNPLSAEAKGAQTAALQKAGVRLLRAEVPGKKAGTTDKDMKTGPK